MDSNQITFAFIAVVAVIALFLLRANTRGARQMESARADDLLRQAMLEKHQGNLVHAVYLFQRASEYFQEQDRIDVSKYSSCLINLADAYTREGKFSEARHAIQRMLAEWQKIIDSGEGEEMINLDYFVATADFGSGIQDVAEFYERVVEAKRQHYGPGSTELINSIMLQSRLLGKAGDRARAQELEEEAEAMRGNTPPPS